MRGDRTHLRSAEGHADVVSFTTDLGTGVLVIMLSAGVATGPVTGATLPDTPTPIPLFSPI